MTTGSPDSIADQLFETRSVLEMHLESYTGDSLVWFCSGWRIKAVQ